MAYNYVATSQRPTAVTHSEVGNFTSPTELNLILAKSNRLMIYAVTEEGLTGQHDVPIYGKIASLVLFRVPGEQQDSLFVLTERCQFSVLSYAMGKKEIRTRGHGDMKDRIGKPVDKGKIGIVDPQSRLVGLHLYEGLFKVIPVDPRGNMKESFNIRLDELTVLDIQFLHGCSKPTIAVLFQDQRTKRHVQTHAINVRDKCFIPGPWEKLSNVVEDEAFMLVPIQTPYGGVLVIGEQSIVYYNGSVQKTLPIAQNKMTSFCQVDDDCLRFFLGDLDGGLHVLVLTADAAGAAIEGLHMEPVGRTSSPSCISYLDSSVLFVGSMFGNSQLIRLQEEADEASGSYVEVLDTFDNLGPIVDMCLVDLDKQGQGEVVACCGCNHDGSLRIIKNGIGIEEQASIELEGIKGMWSLREKSDSSFDKYLVQSFTAETRVLAIVNDEMGEVELSGFLPGRTLFCGNMAGDLVLQVTAQGLVLLHTSDMTKAVSKWDVPAGLTVTVATANASNVVVACSGGMLVHLEVDSTAQAISERGTAQFEHEIACLSLNPTANTTSPSESQQTVVNGMEVDESPDVSLAKSHELDNLLAVGTWMDKSVRLLTIPDLTPRVVQSFSTDTQARSVMLVTLEGIHYLMVGLGDGNVLSYPLDMSAGLGSPALGTCKKIALGSKPAELTCFVSKESTCVFVTSDRPTVVYSRGNKVLYANANIGEVGSVCSFHSSDFPDCLALANDASLMIGTIDNIQKLHIRTVKLGEQPRRIAHNEAGRAYAVITAGRADGEPNFVRFLDDTCFEVLHSHELDPCEMGASACSLTFEGDDTPVIVIGTAYIKPAEYEPSAGRLLVFGMEGEGAGRKFTLIAERETAGCIYCMQGFNGMLLAGCNSRVELYRFTEAASGVPELEMACSYKGQVISLYLRTRGEFIIVGDLMRSISLLTYKASQNALEEIARDYSANWMNAVEMIDDDVFIGAENDGNIFTVRKNADAPTDEERARLELQGEFHVGEYINVFTRGSLIANVGQPLHHVFVHISLLMNRPHFFFLAVCEERWRHDWRQAVYIGATLALWYC
jgi:DNA damage-binding protein 1